MSTRDLGKVYHRRIRVLVVRGVPLESGGPSFRAPGRLCTEISFSSNAAWKSMR